MLRSVGTKTDQNDGSDVEKATSQRLMLESAEDTDTTQTASDEMVSFKCEQQQYTPEPVKTITSAVMVITALLANLVALATVHDYTQR